MAHFATTRAAAVAGVLALAMTAGTPTPSHAAEPAEPATAGMLAYTFGSVCPV